MPRSRTQDRNRPETRDPSACRRLEALLEELIVVFQRVVDTSEAAPHIQTQTQSFASTLPRYEFANKTIFPDFEPAQSRAPLSPVQAWAELRTVLDDIAVELDVSKPTVAAAFLRVVHANSLPIAAWARLATPQALPRLSS